MINSHQFKQLLTPISRLALIAAVLLPVPPILVSTLAVGQPLKPGSPLSPDNSNPNDPSQTHSRSPQVSERQINDAEQSALRALDKLPKIPKNRGTDAATETGRIIRQGRSGGKQERALAEAVEALMSKYDIEQAPGRPTDSHAERKVFIDELYNNPEQPIIAIAVNRLACDVEGPGCVNFFIDAARATGKTVVLVERNVKDLSEINTLIFKPDRFDPIKRPANKRNTQRHPGYSANTYGKTPLFAKQDTSDSAVSPTGTLPKLLSGSESIGAAKSASGGIDFSTLELRYIAENSGPFSDRGLQYAFNASPAASNKNLNAGRNAAVQASDALFVWLSLPPDKFWVNLNPNEPDRIIDPQLAKTDAGRILLQSDFQMKKTVAKLIHPDTSLGKQYWQQLMKPSWQQLKRNGTQPCPPVFRMWIVPAPATVREDDNGIYIADAPLKVKLESHDFEMFRGLSGSYSALYASCTPPDKGTKTYQELLYRKLILPRVEQAVNKAPEYAELRRVYLSRVAAEWYRQRSASKSTTYREMVNHGDISAWPARQAWSPRQVFNQYVNSLKKGEFHVTHQWQEGNMLYTAIYVYGGVDFTNIFFQKLNSTDFQAKWGDLRKVIDTSMESPVADNHGKIWLGGSTTTGSVFWKSIWLYLGLGLLVVLFLTWRTHASEKSGR